MTLRTGQKGFSFIELAVALFIMTLLLGSILVPLGTQVEQRQITQTQRTLEEVREALLGFAVINVRLPCPDTNNDGASDPCAGVGITQGNIPWQTLGLGAYDTWGNRIRYAVQREYTSTLTLAIPAATIEVCETSTCSSTLTTNAAAIIISHGKNGYGATSSSGALNIAPASNNEIENSNNNERFVSKIQTPVDSPAGEFDDVVIWLSPFTIVGKLISAGKLP